MEYNFFGFTVFSPDLQKEGNSESLTKIRTMGSYTNLNFESQIRTTSKTYCGRKKNCSEKFYDENDVLSILKKCFSSLTSLSCVKSMVFQT